MVTGHDDVAVPARRESERPPRRADAERNIAAIIAAGLDLFGRSPNVSMADVARAAGVGRVTLYAHFPSRKDLLVALIASTIDEAERAMTQELERARAADVPADQTLARLISSSWRVLDRHRRLRPHVFAELGPEGLREQHDSVRARFEQLIAQGQGDGVFRTDLPVDWTVMTIYSLLHTAADEVDAGRLSPSAAPGLVNSTLLAALAPNPPTEDASSPAPGRGRPTRSAQVRDPRP